MGEEYLPAEKIAFGKALRQEYACCFLRNRRKANVGAVGDR